VPIADEERTGDGAADESLRLTWLGHSTMLIELDGVRLLTDPLLRNRIIVLQRVAPPASSNVPDVDAILVSHVHYDHLDLPSLRRFSRTTPLVVPVGAGRHLTRLHFADVREVAPGDEVRFGAVTVQSTFAEHEARRHPLGRAIPSLGFLVSGSASVYFAGDTDVFEEMNRIAADLDVALLPVAGWGPRVPAGHLDPMRAAQAVKRLRPRIVIPIHWGTYRRFDLRVDTATLREPADAFAREVAELAPEVTVTILTPGETMRIHPRTVPPSARR
jgi:L-ascorbate metabolism protein UlaG (beta-lactamase superfamily)